MKLVLLTLMLCSSVSGSLGNEPDRNIENSARIGKLELQIQVTSHHRLLFYFKVFNMGVNGGLAVSAIRPLHTEEPLLFLFVQCLAFTVVFNADVAIDHDHRSVLQD